jgi:YVTN family beta-propeller protein
MLNPGLADFPEYTAGQAVSTVVSPDKKTLLILTSGYNALNATSGANIGNQINADSNEYVFVFDISTKVPLKKQVIQVPNTYAGVVFDPGGQSFYVSGGDNDNVHTYDLAAGKWAERAGGPFALGHASGNGLAVSPEAAGLGITADGNRLVVANYYNDSVTVLMKNGMTWTKVSELDLRPGKLDPVNASGVPGGEYPFWVVIQGNSTAYVSSMRDREIDVVNISGTPNLLHRIKVTGQPNKMTINAAGSKLFVAEDESDTVDIIDTASDTITGTVRAGAPDGLIPPAHARYNGHNTNSITLSPDETTLYVTNGNSNDVAVISLANSGAVVSGLIPTGWYPTSVSLSGDGSYMYVVNAKSPIGPNPGNCHGLTSTQTNACAGTNQYDLQLIKAGLQSFPTPTMNQLSKLTKQVAENNHFERKLGEEAAEKLAFLHSKIKHVIYIIKENRTYDQILGDALQGNGDPDLTEFGQTVTPNSHNLASTFVTLDNFYDRSEVSMDGWPWSTSARAPDVVEKQTWVNYSGRGLSYDSEGTGTLTSVTPVRRSV